MADSTFENKSYISGTVPSCNNLYYVKCGYVVTLSWTGSMSALGSWSNRSYALPSNLTSASRCDVPIWGSGVPNTAGASVSGSDCIIWTRDSGISTSDYAGFTITYIATTPD